MGFFRPRCPVDQLERIWVEEMLRWCAAEFGPRTLRTPVVLPTSDFFPDAYTGSHAEVLAVVDRVAGYMGVGRDRIVVEFDSVGPSLSDQLPYLAGSPSFE